ncbi:hypothetical protein EVAR_24619_1 [Eumeta japonica]|uniref:Uncharacterized protein n=1 Tax=Eumeta variegata TaxID=151549 RepID=A0A4C1V2H7_EUMVA|nr:hypothetical protein EVAR_24619_1 [Eumeta japonica]
MVVTKVAFVGHGYLVTLKGMVGENVVWWSSMHGNRKVPNITMIRKNTTDKLLQQCNEMANAKLLMQDTTGFINKTIELLMEYEKQYTESQKREWGFVNAMFYAGTIYTTIGTYFVV